MIGYLSGTLLESGEDELLLNVAGVGYEVAITTRLAAALPVQGSVLELFVHQVVREDTLALYGFSTRDERDVFRSLLRASGVGPKLALAILSALGVTELADAVQQQSVSALTRIAGVGKKTAERLLVELKGKLDGWQVGMPPNEPTAVSESSDEALGALLALGYRPAEAVRMLETSGALSAVGVEEQVRLALRSQLRESNS
ncbi:MAG: Holliday junction branch migration protein RuvA [Pseudomonadota bacterium]